MSGSVQEGEHGKRISCVSLQVTLHLFQQVRYIWKESHRTSKQEAVCLNCSELQNNSGIKGTSKGLQFTLRLVPNLDEAAQEQDFVFIS